MFQCFFVCVSNHEVKETIANMITFICYKGAVIWVCWKFVQIHFLNSNGGLLKRHLHGVIIYLFGNPIKMYSLHNVRRNEKE